MKRRLHISHTKSPVLIVKRGAIRNEKLVYIACVNKPIPYKRKGMKSRIVYIGQTNNGVKRLFGSASERAHFLKEHSIKELKFYLVTCKPRQKVNTPKTLETALLVVFHDKFDEKPKLNKQDGKKFPKKYFSESKILKIIEEYSSED